MNEPMTTIRPVSTSKKRLLMTETAQMALQGFGHGLELDCITFGKFSIIDAIAATLQITGPAKVTVSTWTAAMFDIHQLFAMFTNGTITDFRFIVDRGFVTCCPPQFSQKVKELFGEDAIRTAATHAKFVLIENDEWAVVIRTSMNLNHNARIEYLQVTDSRELLDFYESVCQKIFDEEPGLSNRRKPAKAVISQNTFKPLAFTFKPLQ